MTSLTSSFVHAPARRWRMSLGAASTGALVVAGLLILLASIAVSITLGAADISLVNVRDIVTNHLGLTNIPVRVSEDAIVWQDRMPRALVATGCGIGLSLCGLILQTLLRNALALSLIHI